MANLLDVFTIGFNSDGLKDFEKDLKTAETELDKTEKKVSDLEKELNNLENASEKDEQAIDNVSDSLKKAKDEAEKLKNKVSEMQTSNSGQLLKMKKSFSSLVKSLGLIATVGVAVRQSLQFYEQAEQLDFLAQKSNIAVDSLQRLGAASAHFGGSTEGTVSSVEQFGNKDFQSKAKAAGIAVIADNPEQTLENVAAKMEKLKTDAEKWELSKSLGLDEGTTRLLINGVARYREELKRADKYKLYTKDDIARMRDYQQIQQDIRAGIQNIQAAVARFLLPALTMVAKALRAVTDWASEHEGAVKIVALFIGIAAAVGGAIIAVKALQGALAVLLANPIVLGIAAVIAGITLLIAIIQDLIVWANGGNSALKKWFKDAGYDVDRMGKDLKKFFDGIINGFKSAVKGFQEFVQWMQSFQVPPWTEKLLDFYKKLLNIFLHLNSITGPVMFALDKLNKYKLPATEKPDGTHASGLDYVPFDGYIAELHKGERVQTAEEADYFRRGRMMLAAYNNSPFNSVTPNAISNSWSSNTASTASNIDNSVNINNLTVQTKATDGNGLINELAAINELDNGFVA